MNAPDAFRDKMGAIAAGLGAVGLIIAVGYSVFNPPPPLLASYADGTYQNEDCGKIELKNGVVHFGTTSVDYMLERHKDGVSAITDHFLGVEVNKSGCHVLYDPSSFPLYLSFGHDDPPLSVALKQVGHDEMYVFYRVANHVNRTH